MDILDLPTGVSLEIIYTEGQTILRYERASHMKDLQRLDENSNVCLNREIIPLRKAYNRIGRDYVPRPIYQGVDDSDEIISELLGGRRQFSN